MTDALKPDDTRDALRKIGGLLVGVGAFMLIFRKQDDWGAFTNFVAYLIPAVVLYGGALWSARETEGGHPWQAVFSVFGLVFAVFALQSFVDWIGDPGDSGNALNIFWTFAVIAGLALYAALAVGVRFQLLLASLAAVVSFMALWEEIIGFGDDLGIFRGMLGIASILLLAGGLALWRRDGDEGAYRFSEVLTAAGVAAVIAAGLGITAAFGEFGSFFGLDTPGFETNWFWDTLLLAISVGLIAIATRVGVRGPAYVGAVGLALFLFIAGGDLDSDDPDTTKLVGWPLILLIGGGAALLASLSSSVSLGNGPRDKVKKLTGQ